MNVMLRQNTTNQAWSQYRGVFFDRGAVMIGGKMIGLNCQGLHVFNGTTDNGEDIASIAGTALQLPKRGEKKARSFHVKGTFPTTAAITLAYTLDSINHDLTASAAETSAIGSHSGNLKFYGYRDRLGEFLSVRLANTRGSDFYIAEVGGHIIARHEK